MKKIYRDRLRELADFLVSRAVKPKSFEMCHYCRFDSEDQELGDCGTSGCAGSWATVLFPNLLRLRKLSNVLETVKKVNGNVLVYCSALSHVFGLDSRKATEAARFFGEGEIPIHWLFGGSDFSKQKVARRIRAFVDKVESL